MVRFLSLVLVLAWSVPALSQSLGEAAKKEKERRAGKKGPDAPVITEKDLAESDGKSLALPSSGTKATSPSPSPPPLYVGQPAPTDASPCRAAESLRSEMTRCQANVADAERALKKAEEVAWKAGSSYSATQLIEDAKTRLGGAKRRCEVIEDEARRRGIPPGCLR